MSGGIRENRRLIPAADRTLPLPLSASQQRLWFLHQLDRAASAAYHLSASLRLHGPLQESMLRAALDRIVARHESLRTRFVAVDGTPRQVIGPADTGFTLLTQDLSALAVAEQAAAEAHWREHEAHEPFDLAAGPLIRARLLRLSAHEHLLLVTQHHIVSDGWSVRVLIREFQALYPALCAGQADPLPALPVQYADYAVWQQSQQARLGEQAAFWQGHLEEAPTVLELPADRPRPAVQSYRGGSVPLRIDPSLTAGLRALSQRHRVTLFMTMLAGWSVLLARLSGQASVVVGTPVAHRSRPELEPLIGFFANTLALHVRLDGDPDVAQLLAQVRQTALAAYAHQDIPFEQVVEAVKPPRSLSHSPVFQAMLAMEHGDALELSLPSLRVQVEATPQGAAHFDLVLQLSDRGDHLAGQLEYASDLFEAQTIQRWVGHWQTLLAGMIADERCVASRLPLLSSTDRTQLLHAFNPRAQAYPRESLIHTHIEAQVAQRPEAVALVCEHQLLSYAQLNAQANRLAHRLLALGVQPDQRVALCVERGVAMVVGLLGILKAGAAYVPLDPSHPPERLAGMLADCLPQAVLVQAATRACVPQDAVPVLDLDAPDTQAWSSANPHVAMTPQQLAYVIYTSGSTGRPKGVMNAHQGVMNRLHWAQQQFGLTPQDRVLQKTPYGFDVSVWEFFWPLMSGARLVLAKPGGHQDPAYLAELIQSQGITLLHFVPSMLQVFLQQAPLACCRGLRHVLCSGEALPGALQNQFLSQLPHVALHNLYGPTEAAVDVSYWPCTQASATVPIGRPIAHAPLYILDRHLQPVPVGVIGELHIGGVQVARGYLHRPGLTAERFVADPFGAPGERLYKTGDLCRWRPDGSIEYLGRNDFQVKLRGLRIELGEIEARLLAQEGVREAVVVARADATGDTHLVAYLSPDPRHAPVLHRLLQMQSPDPLPALHELPDGAPSFHRLDIRGWNERLRTGLSAVLPDYMVPARLVWLEALPLNANGKLDRAALPAPEREAISSRNYEAPHGTFETTVAAIWQALLGVDLVGRDDHFFELGGHSLLATQVTARVRAVHSVEVSLQQVFAHPVLRDFAALLEAAEHTNDPIAAADRTLPLPLSASQQRLWFLHQLDRAASAAYHLSASLRLHGPLQESMLRAALDRIVARHESLRTRFVAVDGTPRQVIGPADTGFTLLTQDLSALAVAEQAAAEAHWREHEAHEPFDLAAGPLIRARLLRLSAHEHLLLVTQHHIVSDGWSVRVLIREFQALYPALCAGQADPLPALPVQYADYAVWQQSQQARLGEQAAFWQGHLEEAPTVLELPADRPRPAVQSYRGGSVPLRIDPSLTAGLRALSQRHRVTLFMTMLAGWSVLLARLSGQASVVVGTPVAHRSRPELEPLIGFFANTLALHVRLDGDPDVAQLLAQVRQTALAAYAHQDIPFEQVVEAVKPPRSLSHSPVFQAMLAMEHGDALELSLPSLRVQVEATPQGAAHFDLVLQLSDRGDHLAGQLEYASDLFEAQTIQRWVGHWQTLLAGMIADERCVASRLPLLSSTDRTQLLHAFNPRAQAYPRESLIHTHIEAQVAQRPEAVALVCEHQLLSYAQLNAQANRLAHRLLALGVQPDQRVALCVERGVAMVVGLLGILKAGAAYVPLDPSHPPERLAGMLADCLPQAVLVQAATRACVPQDAVPVLDLDAPDTQAWSSANPHVAMTPQQLAYVIYTSGSTGRPKGVMNAHQGVMNRLHWAQQQFGLTPQDRVLQKTPYGFDVSVWEFFWPLMSGARLVLAKPGGHQDPAYLAELIQSQGITLLHFVPSMLQVFLQQAPLACCRGLRHVLCSGEALPGALQNQFLSQLPHVALHNLYGPTEAAVDVSYWPCTQASATVPIGRPIAHAPLYILDRHLQPVPVGVIGELHIGGVQVARGYLHRPGLTAERFVADPFGAPGERLYKTGDLCRWRPDGSIEYLGRNDFQVKLRGLRIELGEIEARLLAQEGVREAVVVARADATGDTHLVAYLSPDPRHAPVLHRLLQMQSPDPLPALHELPDGVPLFHHQTRETLFLYEEIFGTEAYLKHGLSVGEGACVFDVGANIGMFSLHMARKGNVRIHAFEPLPPLARVLACNAELHGWNARVHACGLGAREEETVFRFYPRDSVISGSALTLAQSRDVVKAYAQSRVLLGEADLEQVLEEALQYEDYRCPVRTLSQVMRGEGVTYIDLLKIDVEGAEYAVLQGIEADDWPRIGQLVVEVHALEGRLEQILALLRGHGYQVACEQADGLAQTSLYNVYARLPALPSHTTVVPQQQHSLGIRGWNERLRTHLSAVLPDYMLPARLVWLDTLPLSANGKLDRAALPAPDSETASSMDFEAPIGDIEETVAKLWAELLGLGRVGRNDQFFELGGHSLLFTKLAFHLKDVYGVDFKLGQLYEMQRLKDMASRIAIQRERMQRSGRPQKTVVLDL